MPGRLHRKCLSWSLKHREICEWVVSVDRRSRYVGPLFGLFDENEDLRAQAIDGLFPDYLFGSYRQNQARFSYSCVTSGM